MLCNRWLILSFTKREIQVLEKLLACGNVQLAAQELNLKPATIYTMRNRIRGKIEQARDTLKTAKKYKRVLGTSQHWWKTEMIERIWDYIYFICFEVKAYLWHYLLCSFGIHSLYICQWTRINGKMRPVVVACRYCPQIFNFKGEKTWIWCCLYVVFPSACCSVF